VGFSTYSSQVTVRAFCSSHRACPLCLRHPGTSSRRSTMIGIGWCRESVSTDGQAGVFCDVPGTSCATLPTIARPPSFTETCCTMTCSPASAAPPWPNASREREIYIEGMGSRRPTLGRARNGAIRHDELPEGDSVGRRGDRSHHQVGDRGDVSHREGTS
jgi:hypothetical protein